MDWVFPIIDQSDYFSEQFRNQVKEYSRGYSSEIFQWIIAFSIGIIFSPLSYGFIYYIAFLIGYEIFLYFGSTEWSFQTRLGVVVLSLFGFIIGRTLFGYSDPLSSEKKTNKKIKKNQTQIKKPQDLRENQ